MSTKWNSNDAAKSLRPPREVNSARDRIDKTKSPAKRAGLCLLNSTHHEQNYLLGVAFAT